MSKRTSDLVGRLRELPRDTRKATVEIYDGWELDDYPQAEDVVVKWWLPMVENPEGTEHDG